MGQAKPLPSVVPNWIFLLENSLIAFRQVQVVQRPLISVCCWASLTFPVFIISLAFTHSCLLMSLTSRFGKGCKCPHLQLPPQAQ